MTHIWLAAQSELLWLFQHTLFHQNDVVLGDSLHLLLKPVRTPLAIFGSLGVCIYVPASRHWLISYSPIHLT